MRRSLALTCLLWLACTSTLAEAVTYYTGPAGSDGNTCVQAQTITTPKLTVVAGLGCLASGETLIIRDGTYVESINNTIPAGTVNARTTVQAENKNLAILRPTTGSASGGDVVTISNRSYITLDGLVIDGITVANNALRLNGTTSFVIVQNGTLINGGRGSASDTGNGVFLQDAGTTDNQLINLDVTDSGTIGSNQEHGIYIRSPRNIVERCRISGSSGHGVHQYTTVANQGSDNVVRYNEIFNNGEWGILLGSGNNGLAHHNIVRGNGDGVRAGFQGLQDMKFYHNTIYNNSGQCIHFRTGTTNSIARNNLCHTNTAKILDQGTTSTITHNLCETTTNCGTSAQTQASATAVMLAPATNSFSLVAGSLAIDNGITISGGPGQSCVGCSNGSAPDIGAHETLAFVAGNCTIPDTASDNQLIINLTGNVAAFAPLYPATSCTGFTAKKNGANNVVTACSRTGDYQETVTLTSAYVNGDTGSFQWASGNVTDGADIGRGIGAAGSGKNQPLLAIGTDQACTNLVGAVSTPTLDQVDYRFERWGGSSESGSDGNFKAQTGVTPWAGGQFRYRSAVKNTGAGNKEGQGYPLRYSKDSGAYTAISTCPAADVCLDGTGELLSSTTTNQLTCATFTAGSVQMSAASAPNVTLAAGICTELLYALKTDSALAAGTTLDFRPYQADGTALNAYAVTGRVTIGSAQSGAAGGVMSGGTR